MRSTLTLQIDFGDTEEYKSILILDKLPLLHFYGEHVVYLGVPFHQNETHETTEKINSFQGITNIFFK